MQWLALGWVMDQFWLALDWVLAQQIVLSGFWPGEWFWRSLEERMEKAASRDSTSFCSLHSITFHWDWDLDTLIALFFPWNTSLACGV